MLRIFQKCQWLTKEKVTFQECRQFQCNKYIDPSQKEGWVYTPQRQRNDSPDYLNYYASRNAAWRCEKQHKVDKVEHSIAFEFSALGQALLKWIRHHRETSLSHDQISKLTSCLIKGNQRFFYFFFQ